MSPRIPTVFILMSTYNGEKYLRDQMASLISQSNICTKIIVRDDGSKDRTPDILREYSCAYPNIEVHIETNVGVVGSFLQLLQMVPPEAEYVALCDQDDVWYEDKTERAISEMVGSKLSGPLLYCAAVEVVDERLEHIRDKAMVKRAVGLENALVQNIGPGCTMVLNSAALRVVQCRSVRSSEIRMHDWWLYQVISATGAVIYDHVPKIKYRQHGGNVIGSASGVKLMAIRVKRYFGSNDRLIRRQASELLRAYRSDMESHYAQVVEEFLLRISNKSLFSRVSYALTKPVYRQSRFDDILLRLLIILSRI